MESHSVLSIATFCFGLETDSRVYRHIYGYKEKQEILILSRIYDALMMYFTQGEFKDFLFDSIQGFDEKEASFGYSTGADFEKAMQNFRKE